MARSRLSAGNRRQAPVVGITGNIGTGKSTVAAMLAELGVHVIDADRVVHRLYADPRSSLVAAVVTAFGTGIVADDGTIDRAALGRVVFADVHALRTLEALVHPAVVAAVQAELATIAPHTACAIEAIKLIESDLVTMLDAVWLVVADPEVQIARLRKKGLPASEAKRRIEVQPSPEAKVAHLRRVRGASVPVLTITNSASLARLRKRVQEAWEATLAGSWGTKET